MIQSLYKYLMNLGVKINKKNSNIKIVVVKIKKSL